jgi:hypothetical protein
MHILKMDQYQLFLNDYFNNKFEIFAKQAVYY